jgi:uncharacterized protein
MHAMSTHEFAIPVHDLDAAGRAFSLRVRPAWLRGALEGTDVAPSDDEGEVEVRLSKSGHDVVIRGHVRAALVVACARCLEPAHIAIREDLTALAVPAEQSALQPRGARRDARSNDPADENAASDADSIPYDGETVILDDLVRDQILLGIPMIPLCSDACPGISQEPIGSSRQVTAAVVVDPRLKPLLNVKKTH